MSIKLTNKSVVEKFYNNEQGENGVGSLISTGDRLFSYSTCIAERLFSGKIIVNKTLYSQITSKHQSFLTKYDEVVTKVPRNTQFLTPYSNIYKQLMSN